MLQCFENDHKQPTSDRQTVILSFCYFVIFSSGGMGGGGLRGGRGLPPVVSIPDRK